MRIPPAIRTPVVRGLLGLATLIAVLVVAASAFHAPLESFSRRFVATLGGPGIALGQLIPDGFLVPLPHEVFIAFGLAGGLSLARVAAWASAGSLLGGWIGFGLGHRLGRHRWLSGRLGRRTAAGRALLDRYHTLGLLLGALAPQPFGVMCWASGAVRMPVGRFAAVSSLRVLRVLTVTWLVREALAAMAPLP